MYPISTSPEAFKGITEKDFFYTFCGERLGKGIGREVFECRLDPSLVVKIEDHAGSFQNIVEWETWHEVRETEFAKWFAPCVQISSCGIILLQKRTTPKKARFYPKEMPAFLGDYKHTNYGWYKGHLCAHDYGRTRLMTAGLTKRMQSVNWVEDLET